MWRRFVLHLVGVFAVGSGLLVAALAVIDPWGAVGSPLPYVPVDNSQRWAYPAMARDPAFDAAIIGNSGARLFDPADLDAATGARFINLSEVSAFPYEQLRLLDVFLAAHPRPAALMIGIERVFCERGTGAPPRRFGYEPIPEWLYDGGRTAAWTNLFSLHAIETAWRSLSARLGLSERPYNRNGFTLIRPDLRPYDPQLAHALVAKMLEEIWPPAPDGDPARWTYPDLDALATRLDRLPLSTRLLLVFVPRYHLYPAPDGPGAAMLAECKSRVAAFAEARPNTAVYDFMVPSPVTENLDRWWDAVHARPDTMALVSRELGAAIAGHPGPDVKVLAAPMAASVSAR